MTKENKDIRICFVHQARTSFVESDLKLLSRHFEVEEVVYRSWPDAAKIFRAVRRCDLVFCWFAKIHALTACDMAGHLGKKVLVIAGGDDTASEPAIGYGMHPYWWKRWCPALVYKMCSLILPFSASAARELAKNYRVPEGKIKMTYLGYDPEQFKPPAAPKTNTVLTVGGIRRENLARKGLRLFVQAAALLPQLRFVLAGRDIDGSLAELKRIAPRNLEFVLSPGPDQLGDLFRQAGVYVQASVHEGFGSAVAEAMLYGCVPVTSRFGSLPEVAGECGVYLDELTPKALAQGIIKAQSLPGSKAQECRQRMMDEFPLKKREQALLSAIVQNFKSDSI